VVWRVPSEDRDDALFRDSVGVTTCTYSAVMRSAAGEGTPVVGRRDERSSLSRRVRALRDGAGGSCLLQGEAGIGKSRLLLHIIDEALGSGIRVAHGSARQHERDRPFGAIASTLGITQTSTDPRRARIAAMLRPGGSSGAARALGPGLDHVYFAVVDDIVDLVVEQAAAVPFALVIDDLQWADGPTLTVCTELLRAGAQLLLLGARRMTPSTAELESLVDAFEEHGEVIAVPRLDEDEISELVAVTLGRAGASVLRQLARAGGNPLFALELLAALEQADALDVSDGLLEARDVGLPPSLRMAVLRRLRPLPPSAKDLTRVAAVFGSSFSVADLSVVLERDSSDLLGDIALVRDAGLVAEDDGELVFKHDVVREAIYEDLGHSTRLALHAEIGRRLAASGASALLVATHMAVGARPGDAEAVGWLRHAAADVAPSDPGSAARLLDQAARLSSLDDVDRDTLLAELVRALLWAGSLAEAERRARAVLDRPHDPEAGASIHYSLARMLVYQGRVRESIAEVRAALESPALGPGVRARLLADLALRFGWTGELEALSDTAQSAIELGDASGEDLAVSTARSALAWRATLAGDVETGVRSSARAMATPRGRGEAVHPVQARFYRSWALLSADRLPEALSLSLEALTLARQTSATWAEPLAHAQLALEHFASGSWDDGLVDAETVVALTQATAVGIWNPVAHFVIASISFHRGDVERACSALDATRRQIQPPDETHFMLGRLLRVQARLAEAAGDREEASHLMKDAWLASESFGAHVDRLELGPTMVRLACDAGDRADARHIAAAVAEVADRAGTPTAAAAAARCSAIAAGTSGPALEAVELLRHGPRPLELAEACEETIDLMGEAGEADDRDQVLALADEATAIYQQLDAEASLVRLKHRLRAHGVSQSARVPRRRPRSGWASLTASERRVVDLVAEGLTNPEIAARLFLSRRTIETHVSHSLAKLGYRSRVDVAAAVARGTGATEKDR